MSTFTTYATQVDAPINSVVIKIRISEGNKVKKGDSIAMLSMIKIVNC
jgi:biotin carboxyl carrier protein